MIVLILFAKFVCVFSCTRSLRYHWLDNHSPTNSSIELFVDSPAVLEHVYIDFYSSECVAPVAGEHRFYCNEKTFRVSCQKGNHWILGLGAKSELWNHYYGFHSDKQRITFHEDKQSYGMTTAQCHTSNTHLCSLKNINVEHSDSETDSFTVRFFSNNPNVIVPYTLFSYYKYEFESNNFSNLNFFMTLNGESFECGENCFWTKNVFNGKELHLIPGSNNEIILNQNFQQENQISYCADTNRILFTKEKMIYKGMKFYVQVLLIVKLLFGVYVTTRKEKEKALDRIYIFDMVILLGFIIENLWFEEGEVDYPGWGLVAGWGWYCYFFISRHFEKNLLESNMNQVSVGSTAILIVLQSTLYELDSYECIMIVITLQILIVFNDLYESLFHFKTIRVNWLLLTVSIGWAVYLTLANYGQWVSEYFDEVKSLIGNDSKAMLFTLYIVVCCAFFFEWKKQKIGDINFI